MNPNLNLGQLSGGDALQQAIAARGGGQQSGMGGLNQMSPSAPGYAPTLSPQAAGAAPAPMRQQGMGGMSGKPPSSEAEIIERAFSDRLKAISNSEKAQTSLQAMPVM